MPATDQPLPVTGGDAKREYVRDVFTGIAPRYDQLNHLLCLNADRRWRRDGDRPACLGRPARRGDISISAREHWTLRPSWRGVTVFRDRLSAADFVPAMLASGRGKAARVLPAAADALRLPFAAAVFDGATVGFGVRNLMDLDAGLRETARVLKPGAPFVVLEFTTPRWQPFRALYLAYFRQVLPRVGRIVSKHRSAYDWLPASVLAFPDPPALAARLEAAGFTAVSWQTLWGGIVAIHVATRKVVMSLDSLAEFIAAIEGIGELVRIREPVHTHLEIAEIADRVMKSAGGGPALLFEHPVFSRRDPERRCRSRSTSLVRAGG